MWKIIDDKLWFKRAHRKGYGSAYHRGRELVNRGEGCMHCKLFNPGTGVYDIYIRPNSGYE